MTMELDRLEPANYAVTVGASGLPRELEVAMDRAGEFAKAEKALNTRRAYRSDFATFQTWCAARGVSALPATAEIVGAFIGAEADRGVKASTIGRRLAAIGYAHRLAKLPSPTEVEAVRAVMRGIRHTIGTAKAPKAPATNDRLLAMIASQNLESRRTNQEVESPARDGANDACVAVLPDRLTAQSVALIVKAHAKRAGLDPRSFAGHSLRSGFLTSAARRGASVFKMMDVSRHRRIDTLRIYVRDAELFHDHAGAGLL